MSQASPLPRLKPDPLPAIHPIPEYAAKGDLKAVYEATKSGLSVPWMGVVTMAFAHYRSFYAQLWAALEPMVASQQFEDACLALRHCAEEQANGLTPSDLAEPLEGLITRLERSSAKPIFSANAAIGSALQCFWHHI